MSEAHRLKKMAKLAEGRNSVLDLGCADMPNPFLKNKNVTGFDIVKKKDLGDNYSAFIQGDVMFLDNYFSSQSFDAIIAGELLEHLRDPLFFLEKCHTVLKTYGLIIVSTPNPNSLFERILTLNLSRKFFYTQDHIMLYPQRWLIRIMEIAGFSDIKLYSGGMIAPGIGLIPFPRPWCYQTIATGTKKIT